MAVHKKKLKDDFKQLIMQLENMILIGLYQPRERLIENDLAKKLNVSRSWIRDALKILETKGLIKMVPYRGAIVCDLNEQEINEIFDVRVVLERLANRQACKKIKKSDGQILRKLANRIQDSYQSNNFENMIIANTGFHNHIMTLSGNVTLIQMLKQLKARFHIFNTFAWSSPDIVKCLLEEHDQFITGLETKDLDLLDDLAERHISHSKDLYLLQLKTKKATLTSVFS